MNPRRLTHPAWCAKDHTCTARFDLGQHRSDPITWATTYGLFIATRVQNLDGRSRLELRAVVDLDGREATAHTQAQRTAVAVDLAVRNAISPHRNRTRSRRTA